MNYTIKLTAKAIIHAEQLLNKAYGNFDYLNEEDMTALLYCSALASNSERMTLEEFKNILNHNKGMQQAYRKFEKEFRILGQFTVHSSTGITDAGSDNPDNRPFSMADLAGSLILAGISADYVLNEMELSDIPFLIKAYEAKKREDMEAKRLWTFYEILPHVDGSKLKSPVDLIVFPWEREEIEMKAQEDIKKGKELFDEFMGSGYDYLVKG